VRPEEIARFNRNRPATPCGGATRREVDLAERTW
jgi:hypothetical protein